MVFSETDRVDREESFIIKIVFRLKFLDDLIFYIPFSVTRQQKIQFLFRFLNSVIP